MSSRLLAETRQGRVETHITIPVDKMRVILPYTHLIPEVVAALAETNHIWQPWDVSYNDYAYWQLLSELWLRRETFCIVEQDVIVRPDTLKELEDCPESWCSFPVPYLGGEYYGLACTKFDTRIIDAVPDALNEVGRRSVGENHPAKHWCTIDYWLQYVILPQTGIARHYHTPALGHYREDGLPPYPSHGCTKRPEQ